MARGSLLPAGARRAPTARPGATARLETQGLTAVELETDLVEGPPAEALVRAAHATEAEEIVVGSRGLGRFRAALGSVSHALLHEADVPVVVVPARRPD